MRFKQFEIRKPTLLGNPPTDDYFKYNFDVVKWADDNSHCWSIARIEYNPDESCFEFSSIGTRYLQFRESGLEIWLLKWSELKIAEFNAEFFEYEESVKN